MHLIDVLVGRPTERVQQFGHDKLSVFGIGRELNEKQWRGAIRQLVAHGPSRAGLRGLRRVEADGERARRSQGRDQGDAARGERRRPHAPAAQIRRGDLAPAASRRGKAGDPSLLGALRAWRSEVARKRGVPAYVVLHDSTIDGIAASRPTTLNELRDIPGIGDKKLEHYGDELIALVKAGQTGA